MPRFHRGWWSGQGGGVRGPEDPRWLPSPARSQVRVFTARQALDAGASRGQVARRLADGTWRRTVGRGIRLAVDEPGPLMLVQSAMLTWPDAVVIGQAAAVFHRAPVPLPPVVDVWRPDGGARTMRGLVPHRFQLPADARRRISPWSVVEPAFAFVDALRRMPVDEARDLFAWLVTHRHLSRGDLVRWVVELRGQHGTSQLRQLLAESASGALSVAEQREHAMLRRSSIGGWQANVPVRDERGVIGVVDVLFEAERVVIEVDGRRAHAHRFQEDRTRQNRLVVAGYLVLRHTWTDLEHNAPALVRDLRRVLASRRRPRT